MSEKILIVEDNPLNMRLIELALRAKGYTLLKATDGKEVIDAVVKELPDIILLDIQLPDISGLEIARRLKKNQAFKHIPIIAVTACAMKGDKERILEAGCNAYLPKPINIRKLPDKVAEMLLKQQRQKPNPTWK